MPRLIAFGVAVILGGLALVHLYWAVRARAGSSAAIPEIDGRPAFRPSRVGTVMVAVALLAASLLVAAVGGVIADPLPGAVARAGCVLLGLLFVARSVGDFRLLGFFKRIRGSRFARLDSLYYSPLCLLIGIAVLYLAYHRP